MKEMINGIQLMLGDSFDRLKELPDNSVDSIVTDPPYGISFMNKSWDLGIPFIGIWKECYRVLKPGGYLLSFAATRTQHKIASSIEDSGFEIRDVIMWTYGTGFPKSQNVGKAIDKSADMDETKQREGWGTALKPAVEPITVARKPPSEKTVAANVLKYGTGAINIDGCRIEGVTKHNNANGVFANSGKGIEQSHFVMKNYTNTFESTAGRWPANFIHDGSDEVLVLFPNTKSERSNGNAARFFYCAKASKKDRNEGCSAETPNTHPTVKPTDLMRYLCRLVTPPNGIVLDPFMGSGSTGKAAILEGFRFIGVDLEQFSYDIATLRLADALRTVKESKITLDEFFL